MNGYLEVKAAQELDGAIRQPPRQVPCGTLYFTSVHSPQDYPAQRQRNACGQS